MYLEINEIVTINLTGIKSTDGDDLQEFSSYFTTEMNPMYSSPTKVSQLIGNYLDGIGEDIINQLILAYSYEAEVLTACDVTDNKWKFLSSQWVSLKVATDVLYNSNLYLGESGGKVYKKLGDFSISKDSDTDAGGPVKGMLDKLNCEIFKLEVAVKNCMDPLLTCEGMDIQAYAGRRQASAGVIKGQHDPNRPMFGRGFVADAAYPAMRGFLKDYRRKKQTNRGYFGGYSDGRGYYRVD